MTYEAATSYLLGTINETMSRRSPGRLDRMAALLRHLGEPQHRYPVVHVGGTSGKGSTATMIAAALQASGKRTALHAKPHLTSMNERARIDGAPVDDQTFADVLGEMMPALEATAREYERPSYYETLLALAFVYFAREHVDVAVIEVGIGGRLDGTNLVAPAVSVITNVGFDHVEILGNTLEEIAFDKAGIAKRGVPLVSAAQGVARDTIEAVCVTAGAPFVEVERHASIVDRRSQTYGQSFGVVTQAGNYELSLPVLGRFQQPNAATAIVALERLPASLRPKIAEVESGFAGLQIPGRMEFFPGYPSVVFDVAHNVDKASSLAAALLETFPGRRFTFVVAIAETKDAPAIMRPLLALSASFVFTSFSTPGRTAERPQRLANIAAVAGVTSRTIEEPIEALGVARRGGGGDQIVVVTGSTFVTGVLREWWLQHVVASRS